jgi:leucyl-tRNA synthetase
VQHVSSDIEKMSFNTAIAKMMEFMNAFTPLPSYPVSVIKMLLQMLYPLAPHIAEECWEIINPQSRLLKAHYPIVNPKYLQDDFVTYVVQVNGKVRARIEAPRDLSGEEIFNAAIAEENVQKFLLTEVQKKVFVPNKLLNIVLE